MTLNVCPVALVAAPATAVWALLRDPTSYGAWWGARTDAITPPGPATPGQLIHASASGLGRRWPLELLVVAVDDQRQTLDLRARFPLGIAIQNHIVVQASDATSARVQFG